MTLNDLKSSQKGFLVNFSQFFDAAHISILNCDEMAGDRLRQPAYEIFSIKRRFQQSKSRSPTFTEPGAGGRQRRLPLLESGYFTAIIWCSVKRLQIGTDTWALEVFESWGSKQWPGPWRARGARACNGGLGAEPPAGSRGRAPGGGSGGRSPPEAESFLVLERPMERQNSKMSKSIRLGLTSQCRRLKLLREQELWPALPCQKLGEQLLPLLPLFQRPCTDMLFIINFCDLLLQHKIQE